MKVEHTGSHMVAVVAQVSVRNGADLRYFSPMTGRSLGAGAAVRCAVLACVPMLPVASSGQVWAEVPVQTPAEVTANGNFGAAIDLAGDWLLIGAPGTDDEGPGSGAAYLYNRFEGGENAWGLVKKLVPPTGAAGAAFGTMVFLEGDRAFVSAPGEPWDGLPVGAVHVFERDLGGSANWGHRQRIVPDTVQPGMEFGASFTANGDLLIGLAPRYDEDPGDQQAQGVGAVVAFAVEPDGLFVERRFLRGDSIASPCGQRPCAGRRSVIHDGSVFFSGANGTFYADESAFLGAPVNSSTLVLSDDFGIPPAPILFTGAASSDDLLVMCLRSYDYIYPRILSFLPDNGAGPVQEGVMVPDTTTYLDWWGEGGWGNTLDIDGDIVVAGAFGHPTFTPLGHADVYQRDEQVATHWQHRARLVPSDPGTGDLFGRCVAVEAGVVAVGAPGHGGDDTGKVYLFSDPMAAVPEEHNTTSLLVYPDPVSSGCGIHVSTNGVGFPYELVIISQDGRVMREVELAKDEEMSLSGMPAGAYSILCRPRDQRSPMRSTRFIVLP